ncbi:MULTISPECIES: rhomboid family intramembrane serine protease [unclassified Lacinutrix]|uniref:rhomboid family intramembrane serine protease n=1 Tax=unclassified Lacinutrix TaxID=2647285 RepID=UPI00059ED48A|nr:MULTISPECIES: rhomboid family intramembrane serine protease [unclassified Lacinutrix]OIQ23038.1 MAG: rhomboid family intramembrane serine protease [Lacinutrix sp. MedPE-SW]
MMKITDTVKHLIIINVIFWIAAISIGTYGETLGNLFAMHFPLNDTFKPWQIITHMFMHATYSGNPPTITIMHILFNMFALWMFGSVVEYKLGWKRFLFLYFMAGLGAVALQTGFTYFTFNLDFSTLTNAGFDSNQILETLNSGYRMRDMRWDAILGAEDLSRFLSDFNTPMVGASGCIMGVLVAFGMLNPNAELMLIFLPIPIKAKYFIPGIIALDVISAFTGASFFSPSNTAFMAHIGGALTGFLIMLFWKRKQLNNFQQY